MTTNTKIGAGQLYLMLLLSRVVLTLTYSINSDGHTISNADWFAALGMPVVLLLIGLPVFWNFRQTANKNLCDVAFSLHPQVGKAVSLGYASVFFLLTVTPVARFSFFVTSTMQPEQGKWFFPLLILPCVVFGAVKGLQAIARTTAILSVIGVVSTLAILAALIPRMEWLNIYTPLYHGWGGVGESLLLLISNSLELLPLLMLVSRVKGKPFKAYLGYAITAPLLLFLILFGVMAVLGEYATLQLFPFYTAAGIAKIGELTNLSAVAASVWIVGVFAKCALNLYLCYDCLARVFPLQRRGLVLVVLGLLAAVLASLSSDTLTKAQQNFSIYGSLTVGGVFILLIPVALGVAAKIQRRRNNETMDLPCS